MDTVVRTKQGLIEGFSEDGIFKFLGVPYAEPPISALHQQFSMLGEFENHVIDTIGHDPDDTFAAVRAGLVSGRFRLGATS